MAWKQIQFQIPSEQLASTEESLSSLGALSVTLRDAEDNPIFEPDPGTLPVWGAIVVQALFPEEADIRLIRDALMQQLELPLDDWRVEGIQDQAWERSWMDQFQPMRFGERLWIVPSWHEPPEPMAINLLLDPGLAFGTGTHATTAQCLDWLDAHPPENLDVLDYGCGSGVLALAALKLGARRLVGVDIDEQALLASENNLVHNKIDHERYVLMLPDTLEQERQFDLVMANILAGPLIELAPRLISHIRPGGAIILSGILEEQAEKVEQAYKDNVRFVDHRQRDEWVCLAGSKQ